MDRARLRFKSPKQPSIGRKTTAISTLHKKQKIYYEWMTEFEKARKWETGNVGNGLNGSMKEK